MRMKTLAIVMLLLIFIGSYLNLSFNETIKAGVNDIYVDDDWYQFRDGTAEHPYDSIQYAIDMAEVGDNIFVFGGEYNETLSIDKEITIIGSIDDGDSIICKKAKHKYTIEITADKVTLENFNITAYNNLNRIALIFITSDNVVIQRNNITETDSWALYLDSTSEGGTIGSNNMKNIKGVCLYHSNNNVLSSNNISNSEEAAVNIDSSNNNILYKNNLSCSRYGIYSSECSYINLSNNSFFDNDLDGIKLYGGSNNIVRNNHFIKNGGDGLDLNSYNTVVKKNIFNYNQMAINLLESNCNICNNSIYNSDNYGIYTGPQSEDNIFYLNRFKNNYKHALEKGDNQWYYGNQGNYWDDYNEVDRDLDGIGDTPYTISGGGIDNYPLGYFLKPPEKPINPVPEDGEYGVGLKVTLEVEVSDPDSEEVDVFFYNIGNGTLSLCGYDYNVKIEEKKVKKKIKKIGTASCSFTLPFDTVYAWKAVINDSKLENESDIWFFTTRQRPPENKKPVANTGGPYTGLPDQMIEFNASGSHDPDGKIDFYRWNFGDGTSEILDISPRHSYSIPDVYYVTLTVVDNNGTSDIETTTIEITEPSLNQEPVALPTGPYSGNINEIISFNASNSYDLDGNIINYTWNFGDGSMGYGVTPTHVYTETGEYTITLTVTDNLDLKNSGYTTASISLDTSETPGFELIFAFIAIVLIIVFWKKQK